MKKIIVLSLLLMFVALPVSAKSLYEYGSFEERAEMAVEYGIISSKLGYTGSYEQNMGLLALLEQKPLEESLGAVGGEVALPQVIANYESSLAGKITSNATTMTLVKGTTDDGSTLSGWYGFTLDVGSSNQEYVIANCTGTACVSMVRGLSADDGVSTSTARESDHRRGAAVKITNHPNLVIITNILNGVDGVPDILYYDDSNTFTTAKQIVDKNYVDNSVNQGAATSSDTVAGIAERATAAEQASATDYGANRPLYLGAKYASSTSVANYVLVAESDGKIHQGWLDLTETYNFTGSTTIADLIYGGTSVTSSGAELNKLDGATTTVTATNLNTLTGADDAGSLHDHEYYNGVGIATNNKTYYSFDYPFIFSTDVPTTNFWTSTTMSFQSNLNSTYLHESSDADAHIITSLAIAQNLNTLAAGSATDLTFGAGKDVIVEFDLTIDIVEPQQQGFGLAYTIAPFVDFDDTTVDSVCFTIDASGNLYAHTANAGVDDTNTAITGVTLTDRNQYRIEFNPGVDAKFYVNGVLKATNTTNLPDNEAIKFGVGVNGDEDTDNSDFALTAPKFSIEK